MFNICKKKIKFNKYFMLRFQQINEINDNHLIKIKTKYLDIINKIECNIKKYCIAQAIYFIIFWLILGFLYLIFIPFLWIDIVENNIQTAFKILSTVISTVSLILTYIFNSCLKFDKKKFIYEQVSIKLKQEGIRLLNHKNDPRYKNISSIDIVLNKFIYKINKKIDTAVIKYEKDIEIKNPSLNMVEFRNFGSSFFGIIEND